MERIIGVENCDHLETELCNVSDVYTGDTCCKHCGKVIETGQTVRPKVPEGGKYTAADGTVYNPGDEMPENIATGDKYEYGDYMYRYNQRLRQNTHIMSQDSLWETDESQNGWGVAYLNNIAVPVEMLNVINGAPITSLAYTFNNRTAITTSPTLPSTASNLQYTFYGCTSLAKAPVIPTATSNLNGTFDSCTSLKDITAIVLTNNITNMSCTFRNSGIVDASTITIPNSVANLYETFKNCKSLTSLPNVSQATGLTSYMGLQWTFSDCTALEDISDFIVPSHMTNLYGTFRGCTSLKDDGLFVIPTTLTDMFETFALCTSLKDLSNYIIPKNVEPSCTFWRCTSLEKLPILENGIERIESTFGGCTALTDLSDYVIPNSVKYINGLFSDCTSLTVAPNLPDNILAMNRTFQNCTALTGTITIKKYLSNYSNCFAGVDFEKQNLNLAYITENNDSNLDQIGATGINYCATCNGKCNGTH